MKSQRGKGSRTRRPLHGIRRTTAPNRVIHVRDDPSPQRGHGPEVKVRARLDHLPRPQFAVRLTLHSGLLLTRYRGVGWPGPKGEGARGAVLATGAPPQRFWRRGHAAAITASGVGQSARAHP